MHRLSGSTVDGEAKRECAGDAGSWASRYFKFSGDTLGLAEIHVNEKFFYRFSGNDER